MKVLEAVSVICCITLLCIQPRESHSSHNLQLEQSIASHNQSEDRQSGHNQSEDSQLHHNQSEDSQSGHNQSEDSQSGHKQSEDNQSGHNQSEDSQPGHNQSEDSQSVHNQSEDSQSGHNQSEDSQSVHNQSEDSQSGHNQSEYSQSVHNQSEDSQSGHNQSEDSQSGHNQSEADSQSGHSQSEDSQSGHNQSEADSRSGHSQSETDSQSGHSQSEHDQSLWEYVRETLQAGCETYWIRLDLSHRNLTHLPPAVFNHSCAWRVVTLDLSHNRLGALYPDSLAPLTSLRALNLSHNQLRALGPGVLAQMAFLEDVNLSDNALVDLSPGTLPGRLLALNASLNRLTQLHGDLFRNVPFLERVDLSHNHISHVQLGAFHPGLQWLFWVSLSHNRLTDFEPWPYVLSQTARVDLSHNVISRFTNRMNFTVTREMQGEVILTYNNLTHLHRQDLTIYLGGQATSAMGFAFFFKWNIRHNPLQCDCHLHWLVDTLSNDLLAENSDAQTYFTCAGPPSLRGRSLGYLLAHAHLLVCDVTRGCPDGCRCADTPQRGHLAVTCDPALRLYTRLPQKLPGDGLLSLNLSGHALRRLEAGWGEVSRLRVLDVSNNRVRQVSASFLDQASHLQVLNLKNNQLTSLPSNLQRLPVDGLHLTGNPLRCSCDLVWFGNWLKAVAANTSSLDPSGSARPPRLPQDTERSQHADPQPRADQWQLMSVNLPKPDSGLEPPPRPQAVPHVPGTLPDSLALTCSLPEGRKMALVDTREWGRGCGSRVTLHVLIGGWAALLVVLVTMGTCWRCRRNVRVLLCYCRHRVRCCRPSPPSAPDDAEPGRRQLQAWPVYEVYVSLDEGDEVAVTWVTSWLLPLLEDMGPNPLPVYLPLKQEPPGVYKAGSRAEAIGQSRKVLVVLSSGYASNGWCRHEFDHACHHLQQYNNSNPIIVVLDLNQATGTRGCRGTAGTGPGGARINRGCNSFIKYQAYDDNDDGRRCIISCQVCNPDKNDDGEENESGDANALILSFRNKDGNAVPSRNRKDNAIPDRNTVNSAVLDRNRKDNAIPDRNTVNSAVTNRNTDDGAVPDRMGSGGVVPNRNRDDGAVPDRMGSSGVVPNRNRDDGAVPDKIGSGGVVPNRNRDDGAVPNRMGSSGVVPNRNRDDGAVPDRMGSDVVVPNRNKDDGPVPDIMGSSGVVPNRNRDDSPVPQRMESSGVVPNRNRDDGAVPDRMGSNGVIPNRNRDDGAVADRMGSSGVVPNRNRDDSPVPQRMESSGVVPNRNRDDGAVPDRMGSVVPNRNRDDGAVPVRMENGCVVPNRNSKGAATAVEDIELDAIDLDMAMNNTDDPGLNKAVTRESRYPHQTPTDDRKDKRYPHQTPTDDRKDKRYPHQTPTGDRKDKRYPHQIPTGDRKDKRYLHQTPTGDRKDNRYPHQTPTGDRKDNRYPHQTPTGDRKDNRYPHQTPTGDRKKKTHLARAEERVMEQLEAMSEFLEDGEVVTLEPLRSFLLQGRYLRTSDWLFKYKLFSELCRQRRGRQD